MPVTTNWVNPADALMDLATGSVVTETWTDQVMSNLLHLGGSVGTVAARVFHSSGQSIAHDTNTVVLCNSESFDTNNIHDNVTNNSRLTCQTAGIYLIGVQPTFVANGTGSRSAFIRLNGVTEIARKADLNAGATLAHALYAATVYRLAVSDYLETVVYQNSGGALTLDTVNFWMFRIGV